MSRFYHAVPLLVELTGAPLFVRMQQEDRPIPMAVGIRLQFDHLPSAERYKIGRAIVALARSRRYMESQLVDGATRHNLAGDPVGPVTEAQREYVRTQRARVAALVAARVAAKVFPPVLERPILTLSKAS